jgi:hypothetical protein
MGAENAIVCWLLINTALAPIRKVQSIISRIGAGPVGFLSKEERKEISSDPRIHHIDANGICGDVIVVTNFKYSAHDRIKIQLYLDKERNDIRVNEAGIFHNASHVFGKKRGNEHGGVYPLGTKALLNKYGCVYERGNISTHISADNYTAAAILEAVCRVATTCKEVVEIPTTDWESLRG